MEATRTGPAVVPDRAVINSDNTIAPTTGSCKCGMDLSYDGQWGYYPLLISLLNTWEPLYLVNRPGNRPRHEDAAGYPDKAIELCREAGFASILLRGDTNFTQTPHLCRRHGSYKGMASAAAGVAVAPGLHAAQPIPAREVPPPREGAVPQPSAPDADAQAAAEAVVARLAEIKRRFAVCKACEHARDDGFACVLHTGCCFGRFRSDLANVCPAGRW